MEFERKKKGIDIAFIFQQMNRYLIREPEEAEKLVTFVISKKLERREGEIFVDEGGVVFYFLKSPLQNLHLPSHPFPSHLICKPPFRYHTTNEAKDNSHNPPGLTY